MADTSEGQVSSNSPAHGHGPASSAGAEHAHAEGHSSPAAHGHGDNKRRFDLRAWLWPHGKLSIENLSFAILFASVAMIGAGIGLGSFVRYTAYLASGGSLLLLLGIVLYIISQLLIPEKQETGQVKA